MKEHFNLIIKQVANDSNNELLNSILAQNDNNTYKLRLYKIADLLKTNQIDNKSASMLINSIIGDYYFDIVMPKEDEEIRHIREYNEYRQLNNIPLFDNVTEGQMWNGGRRMSNLIKDLKLTPKPSGKNSRIAQEKNIKRYCELIDDKEIKTLTLNKIYAPNEIKPKKRKDYKKKYEVIAMLVLLMLCNNNNNGIIKTTRKDLLRRILAVSWWYGQIPIEFYKESLPLTNELSKEHLEINLNVFRKICNERFKDIVNNVLDMLEAKSLIKYRGYDVVVTKDENGIKKYTSMYDSESLNLNKGDLAKMMLDAEHYSANQITVKAYNDDLMKYEFKKLQNIEDVMKYWKMEEYQKHFNKFIKNNYGWEYVFEEIEITLTSNRQYIQTVLIDNFNNCEDLKHIANDLIYHSIHKTIETKVNNKVKAYNKVCEKTIENALANPEIKELLNLDLISESDLLKDISQFKYYDDLIDYFEHFSKYEILKDNYNEFNQWRTDQLKLKYKIN